MKDPGKTLVDAYIKSEAAIARPQLNEIRALIRKIVPGATEKIAWGMPTFVYEGNLITYAAFSKHVSVFPGGDAMEAFAADFEKFTTSKGTLQVPFGQKIPTALLTKIVRFCVKRNMSLAAARAAKKKKKTATKKKTAKKRVSARSLKSSGKYS